MNKEQIPFILIDENSDVPIYRQIYDSIRQLILHGKLQPKTQLPATRLLAKQLNVARMTIINAYEQLFAEGYLESKTGSGTFVAARLPEDFLNAEKPQKKQTETTNRTFKLSNFGDYLAHNGERILRPYNTQNILPFRHGIPAIDEFPFEIWSKILQKQLKSANSKIFSYGDIQGFPPLREAIANHLYQSRGVFCTAEQIIITNGTQQTLDLIGSVFLSKNDEICLEDPTYFGARDVFSAIGAKLIPVSVDKEGFELEEAKTKSRNPRLIYVTPSHQYPLGMTMSLARRMNLLEWARETESFIIEDDYDSEYRYAARPLASLQGLDRHGSVIYIGTFSKTVFPALRLGFLVAPKDLVEVFKTAKALRDWHSPQIDQAVLAEFISDGHFTKHLRKMRGIYQKRQQVLVEEAQKHLKGMLEILPATSGMHLIGWLPEGVDDWQIFQAARKENLQLTPISASCLEQKLRGGFFIGYTAFNEIQIKEGIKKLREILLANLS
ncbi:MAG: PLP-dependent aminotransferase family protein [Pyrinomonadaceae bacterium]|nr:PLP-dependent aminotransferase family protein [Pyrinomonadaceae bacterium]